MMFLTFFRILPNGDFYVGSFKWNQPIGEGVWCVGGRQVLGIYTQTEDREGQEELEDGAEVPPPNSVALVWKSSANVAVGN